MTDAREVIAKEIDEWWGADFITPHEGHKCADSILQALEREGWVAVPAKATPRMTLGMAATIDRSDEPMNDCDAIYKAALEAWEIDKKIGA